MTIDLGIEGLTDYVEIGRGGSARVFRAWQTGLYREVAVKVLHSSWDESAARRFDRERQAMGRLSTHPGIVDVYATGATRDGSPYIVMPLYERGSLEHLLSTEGPQPWQTATDHVAKVAHTLADAHRYGILHRDLKPANILIGEDGQLAIADFGISTLADQTSATFTSGLTFTPSFSPPEAFSTAASAATRDVYGLGATLWALIAGYAPFTEPGQAPDIQQIVGRVLTEPPGDLRPFGVPDAVANVIERAMAKRPEDRPQDAQLFLEELQAATGTASVSPQLTPQPTIERAPELIKPLGVPMVSDFAEPSSIEPVGDEPAMVAAEPVLESPAEPASLFGASPAVERPASLPAPHNEPERKIAFVRAENVRQPSWRSRNLGQVVGIAALIAALLGLFGAGALALLGNQSDPSPSDQRINTDRSTTEVSTTEAVTSSIEPSTTEAPTSTAATAESTEPPTTARPTTAAPTTAPPTTAAPATAAPTTRRPQRTNPPTTRPPATPAPTTPAPTTAAPPTTLATSPPSVGCPTWNPDCN